MAYGRFRRRGFRRFRRRSGFRRFSRYRGANRAMRGYRRPTKMELKLRDAFGTALPLSGTPQIILLNGTTNGSNFWNRLGSRASMKNIYIKLFWNKNPAYAPADVFSPNAIYRISLVYDKQTRGAAPLVSDIWANIDNSGSLTSSLSAAMNPESRDRFVVLMDKFYNTWAQTDYGSYNTTISAGRSTMIKKFIKLKNAEVLYNTGNTGTVSDIESGGLFLILHCSVVATADAPFNFTYNTRLRWTD